MERITLFNAESNTAVEIEVSHENAIRASSDMAFATLLMNTALQPQSELLIENATEEPAVADLDTDSSNADAENSLYRWSTPCVIFYLETYRSMQQKFNSGNHSQKKMWEEIATIMKTKKYNVTGLQCAAKMRSLKKTYKSIKDHNNKSGNDRRTWQFFEIMDEIFSNKAWATPVAIASSTGLSVQQEDVVERVVQGSSADSGCTSQVSSKSNIKILLAKRIRQKEEQEENKKKRHQERMEMDAKLLGVLESLIKK